jgi:hypothetical protein
MIVDCTGRGYVVALIGGASLLGGSMATDAMFGEGYFAAHDWPCSASFMVASLATWVFSRMLTKRTALRNEAEILAGQSPSPHPNDSFCWFSVHEWPGLYLALAILIPFLKGCN